MSLRRPLAVAAPLLLLFAGLYLTKFRPEPPAPDPPGAFSFAVLGDAPYSPREELQFRLLLRDLEAHPLRFVLHVGDIFWRPCTDSHYREARGRLDGLRHPTVYTPGDNEWVDCWEPRSGGFAPRERLSALRRIFFADPSRSLGRRPLRLASQGGSPPYPEFVEHARWRHTGVVFVTAHLIGSRNGFMPFPGRTPADDAAARRRTAAATAWLRAAFAEARATNAAAVVLAFHVNPGLEAAADDPYRRSYEPFLAALEEEAERFRRPVLVVQGDDHEYVVDRPLVRRATGRRLDNLTRLQVPGSPDVGWVRVVVRPGAAEPFAFAPHVLRHWKYW